MDFDKTSFSVDWFTPREKYAPKRLSFPKSARISIDDFVSDSPLSFCFSPVGEVVPTPRSYSFVDTPFERAPGWSNSAPPSPPLPSDREPYPMYDLDGKASEHSQTNRTPASTLASSPGLLSLASDCASCGVDLQVSCVDGLDEQLLVSPLESFTELCWTAAVHDEPTPHVMHRAMRSRTYSFKCDDKRAYSPPLTADYPGSFERARPLAAKISLPLETLPHLRPSESHDTLSTFQEKQQPLAYILYTELGGRRLAFSTPESSPDVPRRSEKRTLTLVPPPPPPSSSDLLVPSQPQPPTPRLRSSKSSQALRVISDACATFARARRKSPI